jgi:hypothetical protein
MANKTSKGQEGYYARYKSSGIYTKNRKRRLERALKRNPENEQIKDALKDIGYRRKKPNTQMWSSSARRQAQLLREMRAVGNVASNTKQAKPHPHEVFSIKHPFSIGARTGFGL